MEPMSTAPFMVVALFMAIGLLAAIACICSVIWVYTDAKHRGWGDLPAIATAVLVFATWPLGLVAWFVMRPAA
jgi:hypothetical protein